MLAFGSCSTSTWVSLVSRLRRKRRKKKWNKEWKMRQKTALLRQRPHGSQFIDILTVLFERVEVLRNDFASFVTALVLRKKGQLAASSASDTSGAKEKKRWRATRESLSNSCFGISFLKPLHDTVSVHAWCLVKLMVPRMPVELRQNCWGQEAAKGDTPWFFSAPVENQCD